MGKIVATEFLSLDGLIEDPGGAEDYRHGGWTFEFERGSDGDKFKLEELQEAEAQLLGRVTYEGFAAAWPQMEEGESKRRLGLAESKTVGEGISLVRYEKADPLVKPARKRVASA